MTNERRMIASATPAAGTLPHIEAELADTLAAELVGYGEKCEREAHGVMSEYMADHFVEYCQKHGFDPESEVMQGRLRDVIRLYLAQHYAPFGTPEHMGAELADVFAAKMVGYEGKGEHEAGEMLSLSTRKQFVDYCRKHGLAPESAITEARYFSAIREFVKRHYAAESITPKETANA